MSKPAILITPRQFVKQRVLRTQIPGFFDYTAMRSNLGFPIVAKPGLPKKDKTETLVSLPNDLLSTRRGARRKIISARSSEPSVVVITRCVRCSGGGAHGVKRAAFATNAVSNSRWVRHRFLALGIRRLRSPETCPVAGTVYTEVVPPFLDVVLLEPRLGHQKRAVLCSGRTEKVRQSVAQRTG